MASLLVYYLIEKGDNHKAEADRKLLAEDIVDLLMSVVPYYQVSKWSVGGVGGGGS